MLWLRNLASHRITQLLLGGVSLAALTSGVGYASGATWGDGALYTCGDDPECTTPLYTGWTKDIKEDGHCVDVHELVDGKWKYLKDSRNCAKNVKQNFGLFWGKEGNYRAYRSDKAYYFTLKKR